MGYATAPNAVSAPVLLAIGIGQTVDAGRIVTLKPKPVDPIIVIPELPPESAPEHQAAVAELIQKLNDVNAATKKVNATREEDVPALPDYGMSLDDFAQTGSSVAEFAPGSWILAPDAKARIKALALLLIKNADTIRYVLIQGSADDIGSIEVNTVISRQRAQAVFDELQRNGVSDEKLGMKVSVFIRPPRQLTVKDKNSERKVIIRVSRMGEESL
jgi:outer membrane protein OmpA-like peptidoglycan-associated protein